MRWVRCWLGDLALLGTTPDIRTHIKPLRGLSWVGGWVKLQADSDNSLGDDVKVSRWFRCAVHVAFSGFLFHREQVLVQVMSFEAQSEDAGLGAVSESAIRERT
jgi:hypothetical protein